MSELSVLNDKALNTSSRPPALRPQVTDISMWVERFSAMAAMNHPMKHRALCLPSVAPPTPTPTPPTQGCHICNVINCGVAQ